MVIGKRYDIIYVDMTKSIETDLFEKEEIGNVTSVTCDQSHFWILANKKSSALGVFLFSVDMTDPNGKSEYLLNWTHKLDIADSSMYIMREFDRETKKEKKFIVLSYKSIGINTFNVMVIDL